ncbi:MAG: TetR/AcrR family transcriptional regulator [Caldilinea sp. CFX5]|nr:TetR/AcrR family transcriptional regulator [Caldilinea sp. CFX5]
MSYQTPTDPITEQILQAAIDLLAQVGDDFTMDQLAEKASVPRATLYRRVGSKLVLLQRLSREQGIPLPPQRDMRTRILQATRVVIGRTGLVNAGMEQIAEEAAVGVATLYRHFGDKEQLIRTMIEELSPRPMLRDLAQPTEDVMADLLSLTTLLIGYAYEFRDILRVLLSGNEADHAYIERLRSGSLNTLDQIATFFAAQMAAGRLQTSAPPREVALAYLGLIFAFTVFGPNHYNIRLEEPARISALIVQIFLNGLAVGTANG